MRAALIVPILLGLLVCTGCSSSNLPSPTATAEHSATYAMNIPEKHVNNPEKRKSVKPREQEEKSADSSPDLTDGVAAPHAPGYLKPFSPEWVARERQDDEKLKKVMSICQGC
jgi:hypothetical protein